MVFILSVNFSSRDVSIRVELAQIPFQLLAINFWIYLISFPCHFMPSIFVFTDHRPWYQIGLHKFTSFSPLSSVSMSSFFYPALCPSSYAFTNDPIMNALFGGVVMGQGLVRLLLGMGLQWGIRILSV